LCGCCFAASLINYFDRQTLAYAMPLVAKDFNLDATQQALVFSAFFWTYTYLQIPIGLFADRTNLRWLYAGAFALWSFAQGITGFAGSVGMLIACRMLLGIGESIYLVGGTKVVSLLFPLSQRGLPCGIFDAGTRTGLVLEGLIIGTLLTALGWRTTFMIVGFAALIWLLPWFLATPPQLRDTSAGSRSQRPRVTWSEFVTLFAQPRPAGRADRFLLLRLLLVLSHFVASELPRRDTRDEILKAAVYTSLPMLVFGICLPLGGWIADRLIGRGWDPARTRKTIITVAFLSGLLVIPSRACNESDHGV
jgi:MFS family permease